MSPEQLFWDLVEPLYADPAVTRSTMMGLPCVRLDGRFFASLDRRSGALLVKLSADRVGELVAAGHGQPFAPAGRVFREWVAVPRPDRRRWRTLLAEARDHAAAARDHAAEARDDAAAARDHATAAGITAARPRPAPPAAGVRRTGRHHPAVFAGFGAGGLDFLAGLEADNTAGFFDTHRGIYERDLLAPAKLFVTDLGQRLRRQVSTGLQAVPRVGGSIFRIANDRRFAPHAPPYKPYLDFAFWEGSGGPRTDPSLIVRIAPDHLLLGAGVYSMTGQRRDRYRAGLHEPNALAALDEAVEALLAAGAELGDPTRSRPPKGFDAAGPAARYAVRERLHVTRRFPVPSTITTVELLPWVAERLQPFAGIHRWLTRYTS